MEMQKSRNVSKTSNSYSPRLGPNMPVSEAADALAALQ